jgi:hypothetical protein
MPNEQREEGKHWVISTLLRLAANSAPIIDRADWHRSADDARASTESLGLEAQGQRFVETFPLAQLEDIPGDSGVEAALKNTFASWLHGW